VANLVRLENKLKNKGIENTEITRQGRQYYVLHICKNGAPVPLCTTTDRKELQEYIDAHY